MTPNSLVASPKLEFAYPDPALSAFYTFMMLIIGVKDKLKGQAKRR